LKSPALLGESVSNVIAPTIREANDTNEICQESRRRNEKTPRELRDKLVPSRGPLRQRLQTEIRSLSRIPQSLSAFRGLAGVTSCLTWATYSTDRSLVKFGGGLFSRFSDCFSRSPPVNENRRWRRKHTPLPSRRELDRDRRNPEGASTNLHPLGAPLVFLCGLDDPKVPCPGRTSATARRLSHIRSTETVYRTAAT
jgi:hypothetical protein